MDFKLPLAEFTDELKEAIEYWKEYRGQRIRIDTVTIGNFEDKSADSRKCVQGVEGDVEKVMTLPPGLVLTDVQDYIFIEDLDARNRIPDGEVHSESRERMFISFDSIERMHFVEEESD